MENKTSWIDKVIQQDKSYPSVQQKFIYGTAGFRTIGTKLIRVCYRIGVFITILTKHIKNSYFGIQMTASHNDAIDNGVKIMNQHAQMLPQQYEPFLERLVNIPELQSKNIEETIVDIQKVSSQIEGYQTAMASDEGQVYVLLSHDTRSTSDLLIGATKKGIECSNGIPHCYGLLTTPQLHFLVNRTNIQQKIVEEQRYYEYFGNSFLNFISKHCKDAQIPIKVSSDCSYGVGGPSLIKMLEVIKDVLQVEMKNVGQYPANQQENKGNILNDQCGAEYVQKKFKFPKNFTDPVYTNKRCFSFDGDADRLVSMTEAKDLILFDGDKVAVLLTWFINKTLGQVKLDGKPILTFNKQKKEGKFECKFVQTAYANGASQAFLRDNFGIESFLEKTGVKYMHPRVQNSDLGLYFEANGHGTMVLKVEDQLINLLNDKEANIQNRQLIEVFLDFFKIANHLVGDAIADMLLVESVLCYAKIGIKQWKQFYTDYPSAITKVAVKDRQVFKTNYDETRLIKPTVLQDKIDEIVKEPSGKYSRTFLRASGTQNVVRIYAESETLERAQKIVDLIATYVQENYGA